MPTTPTEWQSFMRCRSGKARWKTKKKKVGAALDPTHHQRGCHPERRSDPSAPRQGIKTASAPAEIAEREREHGVGHCQCCRFSDLLSMTPYLAASTDVSIGANRPTSIVAPNRKSANNNSAKKKCRRRPAAAAPRSRPVQVGRRRSSLESAPASRVRVRAASMINAWLGHRVSCPMPRCARWLPVSPFPPNSKPAALAFSGCTNEHRLRPPRPAAQVGDAGEDSR
jgi:hypothetical protein